MAVQIRKTYRGLNHEMLCDEVRILLRRQGIMAVETESQTYGLPSGATQSRATLVLRGEPTPGKEQSEYGSVHILGAPRDEAKMLLEVDDELLPREKLAAFQDDLDFMLGSYEVKW
jgi:hypothetical protein